MLRFYFIKPISLWPGTNCLNLEALDLSAMQKCLHLSKDSRLLTNFKEANARNAAFLDSNLRTLEMRSVN